MRNAPALRLGVLVLTTVYGVVMWFCGPRLWPTPRFALVVATVVYMFMTLLRSTRRASEPGSHSGSRFWSGLADSRQFTRLHAGILMMLGIAELGIRSETDVPAVFTAVNDVFVTLLLVTAAATTTLMVSAIAIGLTPTAKPSR
jgi:predicted membrane protein